MQKLLLFLVLLISTPMFAQKMFESGEWCAHNKNSHPILPPPADGRSDSINLTHAWVTLDMSQSASQQISGNCRWAFTPVVDQISSLRFDLLALTVDSVIFNHQSVAFQRSGEQIIIPMTPALNVGVIYDITIYYHGTPQKDASGWGGFYFSGDYAFNLGVGFDADPHVFGRAWFPCFDNFEERSTYTFDIYTTPAQPAYCNGYLLTDETTPDNLRRRLWLLNQPIPSYLACVAIGPYTSFTRTYPGQNNPIPVEIAAPPGDTNKVRTTFQHMPEAIQAFEYWYGPYKWPKIGFSLVPFGSGAMEHATNVAIGRGFINGTTAFETLWAHELSHHWWGDLATCSTQEDMWLNEGWATFSEHLFTEWVYGRQAYRDAVRTNFLDVLQTAHLNEGGYRAVSGIPHSLTYGKHVYNKGAVVAHNLRAYMGDELFRLGMRYALENTSFTDWSSADFRDKLELATGLDLHPFFNDWVFNGGYPDYSVDSVQWQMLAPNSLNATVHIKQKRRGAPAFHLNVPLEITAVDQFGRKQHFNTQVSGEQSTVQINVNPADFTPVDVWVNTNLLLLQARSDGEKMLKTTGNSNFQEAKFNLSVGALGADSVLFRVEHHFAAPDNAGANPGSYALTTRYWQVYGQFPATFDASATIFYDGRGQMDQLDTELFAATGPEENSLVLLYRPGAGHPWQPYPTYTRTNIGTQTDKFGQFKISALKAGQYTIGKSVAGSAVQEVKGALGRLEVFPNPTSGDLNLIAEKPFDAIQVVDLGGKIWQSLNFERAKTARLNLALLPAGAYHLIVQGKKGICSVPVHKF